MKLVVKVYEDDLRFVGGEMLAEDEFGKKLVVYATEYMNGSKRTFMGRMVQVGSSFIHDGQLVLHDCKPGDRSAINITRAVLDGKEVEVTR